MNHFHTTHNGSPGEGVCPGTLHTECGMEGEGRARHAATAVGGHVEPSASLNTFPGYYCLFTLEGELHGNFNR